MRLTGKTMIVFGTLLLGLGITLFFIMSDAPSQSGTDPHSPPSGSVNTAAPGESSKDAGSEGAPGDGGMLSVQTTRPVRRDISHTLTLPANIAPWLQATLYAKVPGYLKWMGADKGDKVKQGQLLAILDAPEVEQQFQQAESDYKIKSLTYHRLLKVWKENPDVIAKQDLDVAEATAEGAKHLMENRRTLYAYTKVDAPFTGTITARFADPGTMIQSGAGSATQAAPLYTLMDLEQVRIYVNVPQEAAPLAKPGIPTTITVKELPEEEFTGAITRTTEALDPATRTLLVEIDMPNEKRMLQPGMFVAATLHLERHQQVLSLPPGAIITASNGSPSSVFVVKNGRAVRKTVKTGIDDGVAVEIVQGITEDDDVVIVGKAGLKEGLVVRSAPYSLPTGKPSSQKY